MEIRNFSFSVEKYFTSECSKRVKYFATKGVYFYTNTKGAIHCATIASLIFSFVKFR